MHQLLATTQRYAIGFLCFSLFKILSFLPNCFAEFVQAVLIFFSELSSVENIRLLISRCGLKYDCTNYVYVTLHSSGAFGTNAESHRYEECDPIRTTP